MTLSLAEVRARLCAAAAIRDPGNDDDELWLRGLLALIAHRKKLYKPYDLSTVAGRLHYARQARGLTPEQLARRVRSTKAAIRNYELGRNAMPVKIAQRIAVALDVPLPWLALETDEGAPTSPSAAR